MQHRAGGGERCGAHSVGRIAENGPLARGARGTCAPSWRPRPQGDLAASRVGSVDLGLEGFCVHVVVRHLFSCCGRFSVTTEYVFPLDVGIMRGARTSSAVALTPVSCEVDGENLEHTAVQRNLQSLVRYFV